MKERRKHGVLAGEDSPHSKLTKAQVIEIRKSKATKAELATEYKTSISNIRAILKFETWKQALE